MEPQVNTTNIVNVQPQKPDSEQLVKKFSVKGNKNNVIMVIASLVVVTAGIATGYLLSGKKGSTEVSVPGVTNTAKEAGMADAETFKDSATGIMKSGGINGEGTHHLERDGGPSQYVYLTSTVIDMESFVDKNVQVWGQTISAKKAGWLMDVGKLKVME